VPEAPAIPYLILGIASLVSYIVAVGIQKGYAYTFALLLVKLAETCDKVRIPTTFHTFRPLKPVADGLRWLNRTVFAAIGWWVATSEKGVAYFFTALAQLSNWLAHEIAQLAKSTFRMGRGILARVARMVRDLIRHYVRPLVRTLIRLALRPLRAVVRFLWRRVKWLAYLAVRALRAALTALRYMSRYLLRRLLRLERLLLRRLAQLARRVWTAARLRKLIRAMIRAVKWEALTLRALGRLGLGWLRAIRVRAIGRWLLRHPSDLLSFLLTELTVIEGGVDLRTFARAMQGVVELSEEATKEFWRV
jgi:hypothetical protein